jgi:NAD(P) transhydrogenase
MAAYHTSGSDAKEAMAKVLPAGIETIPEVSAVGPTEPQPREKRIGYVVGRADYAENPWGKIIGDKVGCLKLIIDTMDLKLLGVRVIGERVCEPVHIGVTVLMTGGGPCCFLDRCFNYPKLGDLYKPATHDALIRRGQDAGKPEPPRRPRPRADPVGCSHRPTVVLSAG